MTTDELADIVIAVAHCSGPDELREILIGEPRLLDPGMDDLFDWFIQAGISMSQQAPEEREAHLRSVEAVVVLRKVLLDARGVGIAAAIERLQPFG
ncbi:hypothetical protein ACPPVO_24750 [Dactylosporangium sp. McL0621]|uniref:hypothetical protein n=1 Tax=Dactylosporangium sp. McL0621 TaxID=3415678 RepID=UPI003CEA9F99